MKKIAFILISIIVVLIMSWFLFIRNAVPDIKPIYNKIEISSDFIKDTIFLKRKSWGLTSDNEITIISKSPNEEFEADSTSEFVFKGESTFFYKQVQDTLLIYVRKKVAFPSKFGTKFKIIQLELSNPEMMNLLSENKYKESGLKLF